MFHTKGADKLKAYPPNMDDAEVKARGFWLK